jgi:transglutaminase-like putative cysteine protease
VGGSIPVRFKVAAGAPLIPLGPGFAALNQNLPPGFRYTVLSHTARPSVAALRRSPPDYPAKLRLDSMFDVGDGEMPPPFGTLDRRENVLAVVAYRHELRPYLPLARLAEKVAGGARTPYDAVEDLERWFVSSGTFRYSNHPAVSKPALVGFVTKTHAGYCQYFAGAMALMLRYLGIPARVAVGFAGGTYDPKQHVWNVSDREAHAWVEVWFKGYGWVPFDPTPAAPGAAPRQTEAGLAAVRTGGQTASGGRGTAPAAQGESSFEQKLTQNNGFGAHRRHEGAGSDGPAPSLGSGGAGGGTDRSRPVLLLLACLAAGLGGIVLTKIGFRLTRNARRDPRAVAAAGRQELVSFLLDQGIEAPPSATLGELGAIVKRGFGVDPEAFVAAATAARFGPPEEATGAAATARRELRTLLGVARRGLTWRARARGLLSLRSLMRPAAAS